MKNYRQLKSPSLEKQMEVNGVDAHHTAEEGIHT